jgi:hypothetical protein
LKVEVDGFGFTYFCSLLENKVLKKMFQRREPNFIFVCRFASFLMNKIGKFYLNLKKADGGWEGQKRWRQLVGGRNVGVETILDHQMDGGRIKELAVLWKGQPRIPPAKIGIIRRGNCLFLVGTFKEEWKEFLKGMGWNKRKEVRTWTAPIKQSRPNNSQGPYSSSMFP